MDTCHQFEIKQRTLSEDLEQHGSIEVALSECVFKAHTDYHNEFAQFICRYEWLGKMSPWPTHYFTLRYNEILICLVVMDMPTVFSKMLGENTRKVERLISRGASISFAPKNTASYTISRAIRWCVENTPFRLFCAYSDPEAGELGTIYQSLNFYYLGNRFGTSVQYFYNKRWTSDRVFRNRSAYKRYAKALGITWQPEWQVRDRIVWENIPDSIESELRQAATSERLGCPSRKPLRKHKYAYVLGSDRRETRTLRQLFGERNKTYPYPKERGR